MTRTALLCGILLTLVAGIAIAQSNPFLAPDRSEGGRTTTGRSTPGIERLIGPFVPGPMGIRLVAWQRDLNSRLTTFMRDTSQDGLTAYGGFLVMVVAFFYGALHAILPGHRKTVIISYFLYEPAPLRTGVIAGFMFAALHAMSAIAVVLVAFLVLETAGSAQVNRISYQLQIASSLMIIAVGLLFFGIKMRSTIRARRAAAGLRMNLALGFDHGERMLLHVPRIAPQRLIPIVVATGVVPCPITTLVLLFSLSFGILGVGLIAAVAMSLGLGVALSAIAALTIAMKERFVALLQRRWGSPVQLGIELSAALLLVGFGFLTLVAAL